MHSITRGIRDYDSCTSHTDTSNLETNNKYATPLHLHPVQTNTLLQQQTQTEWDTDDNGDNVGDDVGGDVGGGGGQRCYSVHIVGTLGTPW